MINCQSRVFFLVEIWSWIGKDKKSSHVKVSCTPWFCWTVDIYHINAQTRDVSRDGLFYCHIKAIKARIVITRVLYFEVFLSTLGHKLRYHKALKKEAIDNSDNNSTDFFVQPEIGGHFGPFWALGTSVTTNYKILFLYMHLWLISQDSVRLSTKLFKLYDMRR